MERTADSTIQLWVRDFASAAAGGALLALAFPKADVFPLAWIALAPLLSAAGNKRPAQAAVLGFAFGCIFFGLLLYWVMIFGKLPWALLSAHQALFFAAFAAGIPLAFPGKALWGSAYIAASWAALEWLRSLGFGGFTWGSLAVSQYRNLPFLQLSSLAGPWGLSFLIAFFNASLAESLASRNWKPAAFAGALVLAAHLSGLWMLKTPVPQSEITAAVVQGSVEQGQETDEAYIRNILCLYSGLTREAAISMPGLIVWPETVIPSDFNKDYLSQSKVSALARELRADAIVGASACETANGKERIYNGAFFFDKNGTLQGKYYKVHLVPFGEKVPLRNRLPLLDRYPVRDFDYSPGPGYYPIGRYGAMICFESIFPYASRHLVRNGAELLVVITNDGWFKRTAAARQHLAFSALRAVENRRWLVRCASTGISCFITPNGEITAELAGWKRGALVSKAGFSKDLAFYTRFGDWFAFICLLFWAGRCLWLWVRRSVKSSAIA